MRAKLTPALVRVPIGRLLRDASAFALREARTAATGDAVAIARTLTARVMPLQAIVQSSHPGALAVEFGRHPGTPMPPPDALRSWAARHGLEGLEFPIARAIARRGIKGRFFMRRARQKLVQQELPRLLDRAARDVAAVWARD